jgi:hypothetical protein
MDTLYETRRQLLPILEKHNIQDFLILNEPEFVLLRMQVNDTNKMDIEKLLIDLVAQSKGNLSRVTLESWSPENDAKERILGAARQLGLQLQPEKGWMIAGREPLNKMRVPAQDDLDVKTSEFALFMTKVVGQFTRAYVKHMPRRTNDRWLLSVMIHLLMNSISLNNFEENEREFPYV